MQSLSPDAAVTVEQSEFGHTGPDERGEAPLQAELTAGPFRVGRYIVLDVLGSGGMGVVYAAYDEQLDRKVALKFFYSADDEGTRQRASREAQALAKLSHPNIVQVYEVGEHQGQLYIAMEFVEGQSLREWLQVSRRPSAVLEVMIEAGRGLHEAHCAGLVHRDFKPDNVLVDLRGHAVVVDFGLARAQTTSAELETTQERRGILDSSSGAALHRTITKGGQVVGTPAYMAPEQYSSKRSVAATADQFAFCVTLFEALYGGRPFQGRTPKEQLAAVKAGPTRPTGPGPRWVYAVLAKGLAWNPEDRHASMDVLIRRLVRNPPRVAVRSSMAAVGLSAALAAGFGLARAGGSPSECDAVETLWDAEIRAKTEAAVRSTGVNYADSTWKRIDADLTAREAAWQTQREDACRVHETGLQSSSLFDQRMSCLDDQRHQFESLLDTLGRVDAEAMPKLLESVTALPGSERCGDVKRLLAEHREPDDPAIAAQLPALREEIKVAAFDRRMGDREKAVERLNALLPKARETGHAPLIARALADLAGARVHLDPVGARAAANEGLELALEHGLDAEAADSLSALIYVGFDEDFGPESVLPLEGMALALARKDGKQSEALMNSVLGTSFRWAGQFERAIERDERAIEVGREAFGEDSLQLSTFKQNAASAYAEAGKVEEGLRLQTEAVELRTRLLGADHPRTGISVAGLGDTLSDVGRPGEAREAYERGLRIMREAGYTGPGLLTCYVGLGNSLKNEGKFDAAYEYYMTGLKSSEELFGPNHPSTGIIVRNLGNLHSLQRDWPRALAMRQRLVDMDVARVGPDSPRLVRNLRMLAATYIDGGKLEEAEAVHDRALALMAGASEEEVTPYERLRLRFSIALRLEEQGRLAEAATELDALASLFPDNVKARHSTYGVLFAQGRVALARGRAEEAIEPLKRALGQWDPNVPQADLLAKCRFTLARALQRARQEPDEARSLAKQAYEAYSGLGEGYVEETAAVRAWLDAHP